MIGKRSDILKAQLKSFLKDIYYFPLDLIDSLSGKRDEFTPPRRLNFVGGGGFKETGNEFLGYFVKLCELQTDHKILEVGCGNGRMAMPLTKFLGSGSYDGFDIVQEGIKWSTKTVSSRHSNFHFHLADVYNKLYNPAGKHSASEYRFPFADESFDVVFLTSVFTHMLPADLNNYLSEIARVLKSKGKILITYFLINNESRNLILQDLSQLQLKSNIYGYWTLSQTNPEAAVGYEEEYIRNLYRNRGLSIVEPIRFGSWSGREQHLSYQDIIIATKP